MTSGPAVDAAMGEARSVLIAGCGYVGTRLGTLLAARGDVVLGLRRSPGTLPEGITRVKADLCAPETLSAIPAGVSDVVITTAPGGGDDERYRQAYVEGPENLLTFLRDRGDPVKRVLLTTSTGVYAQTDGDWVDERSPTEPTHFSGQRMLEGEAVIAAGEFESVAVRLAGIYGPGRTRLIDRMRNGEARAPRHSVWTNRIHRDDCAGLLEALLDLDAPPAVVVGVDQEPAQLDDVQRFLAAELSVAVPEAPEPAEATTARRTRTNKRCSNALALSLGYRFRFPSYREGYRAMLAAEAHRR